MNRRVRCQRGRAFVPDDQCDQANKPSTSVSCQTNACPNLSKWVYTNWSQCSKTCGTGEQTRQRHCQTEFGRPSNQCDRNDSTQLTKLCFRKFCPEWQTGSWSTCSRSCGGGRMTRDVYCDSNSGRVTDTECNKNSKPSSSLPCETESCPKPQWVYSEWSACSTSCGPGQKIRFYFYK